MEADNATSTYGGSSEVDCFAGAIYIVHKGPSDTSTNSPTSETELNSLNVEASELTEEVQERI